MVIPTLRVLVACVVESRLGPGRTPADILHEMFDSTPYPLTYEELDEGRFLWCVTAHGRLIPVYE